MHVKSSKLIYFYVGIVAILATFLFISRFDYVVQWEKHNYEWNTNNAVAWKNALSDEEVEQFSHDTYCILYDQDDESSIAIQENIKMSLTYMKKEYQSIDVTPFVVLDRGCKAIVITFSQLNLLQNSNWVDEYVHNGGYVVFATMPEADDVFYQLYRKMGINSIGDYVNVTGMEIQTDILLQAKDIQLKGASFNTTVTNIAINNDCVVHITSNDVPIVWEVKYGKGKYVVFNSNLLQEKMNRGMFVGAISTAIPDFIYPIYNMKIVYIDDFPAPFPQGINKDIYKNYRLSTDQFYSDIWWPDMYRLANKYDLKYTAGLIQDYNNRTEPPFQSTNTVENGNLVIYGRELLKNEWELGLHGYNHQSLVLDPDVSDYFEYNPWPNQEAMELSLTTVREYISWIFPSYKVQTYIPPSNVLSDIGREALKNTLPNLKNISSLYNIDPDGYAYSQEFEVAPDGIVELPRITSGFQNPDYQKWDMINGVNVFGVFSHFIHPDDVIAEDRNYSLSWEQLYQNFIDYMEFFHKRYAWMRALTASEASMVVESYDKAKVFINQDEHTIRGYINRFSSDLYFILRTDKRITNEVNCSVKKIANNSYLVLVNSEKFEIGLRGS